MLARLFSSLASFSPGSTSVQDDYEADDDVSDIHSRALLYPNSACSAETVRTRIIVAREKRSQKGIIFDSGEKVDAPSKELLAELLFGTIPLSYKGPSTKLHLLSAATGRLLVSHIFPSAIRERSGSTTPTTVPSGPSSLGSTEERRTIHGHPRMLGRSNTAPLSMTENVVQGPQLFAIGLVLETPLNYDISLHWRLITQSLEQLSQTIVNDILPNGISESSAQMSEAVKSAQKRLQDTGIPNVTCGMRWDLWVHEASWFTNASEAALRQFFDITLTAYLTNFSNHSGPAVCTVIIGKDSPTLHRMIFLLASFITPSDVASNQLFSPVSIVQHRTSHPVLRSVSDRVLGWDIPQHSPSSHFTESHASTSGTLVSSISSHSHLPAPNSPSPKKHLLKADDSWNDSHLSNSDSTLYSQIPNVESASSLDPSKSLSIQWKDRIIDVNIEMPKRKERSSRNVRVAGYIDGYSPGFILQGNPQFSTDVVQVGVSQSGHKAHEVKFLVASLTTLRVTSVFFSKGEFQSQPLTKIDLSLNEAVREATSEGTNNALKAWLAIHSPDICLQ